MKRLVFISAVLCVIAGAQLSAAENPWVGTWKLNPARSRFTGETISYERLTSGEWKATRAGMSYTFRMDGKQHPSLFGRQETWKQASDRNWESTTKSSAGTTLVTQHHEIAPDNKTMKVTSQGTTPSGEKFNDVSWYNRESGKTGLAGKWKSQKVQISAPTVLEIKQHGSNGMTIMLPAYKASVDVIFDGTDAKPTGPTVPPGLTFSAKKLDNHSFEFDEKNEGKPVFKIVYEVSPDGKTMTETATPVGVNETTVAVFEREK